ncbi:hypothetical protein ANN_10074 [Periplaneta americana]|uniref:Uncharacterized protein n=1 Tax=Periplaneta americana TaxID=6978 RepID=A0ABQ8TNC2_PERAM|nr:hypothetical protein ANN_10074 [Periplaneta americana]
MFTKRRRLEAAATHLAALRAQGEGRYVAGLCGGNPSRLRSFFEIPDSSDDIGRSSDSEPWGLWGYSSEGGTCLYQGLRQDCPPVSIGFMNITQRRKTRSGAGDPGQTSHSAECAPSIMAVDIGHVRQHICLTWSQATKENIKVGEFDLVLWIEFGVAQWSERLPIRGGPPAWGLGEGLTTHHRKKQLVTKSNNKPRNGTDSPARPQLRNKVMRFGTWHRWEDNIKMYLREVGYDGRDWINLAQDKDLWRAYVRAAMDLRVP